MFANIFTNTFQNNFVNIFEANQNVVNIINAVLVTNGIPLLISANEYLKFL